MPRDPEITLFGERLRFDKPKPKDPMVMKFRRCWFGSYYIHSVVVTKIDEGKWHVRYDPAWWQKVLSALGFGPTRSRMRMAVVTRIAEMVGSPLVITGHFDKFNLEKP